MKLRNKVSVILVTLWCVLVIIAYAGSQLILGQSYLNLENKQADENMQRIDGAFQQVLASVSTMADEDKILTPTTINKIRQLTKLNVSVYPLSSTPLTPSLQEAYTDLQKTSSYILNRTKSETMIGYKMLKDINGNNIAIIKSEMPRNLYQIGIKTIKYFNMIFILYSLLLIGLLWFFLQNLLVKRLERLKEQIGAVDGSKDYFNNIISGTHDEVSSVASLYHQATHDPLTGLANRNLLERVFINHVKKPNNPNIHIAILFLDIDHFKRVNDSLGHEVGDMLLIEVARQLSACLREHDLAVRLGGDEFVVMLVDISISKIQIIIDRIYKSFSNIVTLNGHEIFISSSMGIAIYPDDGLNISTLLKNADMALYNSKEKGRNHYQYYSNALNLAIQESYRKVGELQRAIDNKELCLFYQPIYDVITRRILCIETLLRWQHPQRGLLSAAEIIPIAESSGLIIQIGKWVLETACTQMKAWQERGLVIVPIAVNISLHQVKNTSIDKLVSKALEVSGLDPRLLELELTETSYVEISQLVLSDMQLLKNKGVTLVVDDFGIGYSGLAYLRSLPVTKLKIDRSFIHDILINPDDRAITLAIIAIAHQLDLEVVAEGVESAEQFEFLKLNNVDAAQGNYLSRPLDVSECEALLNVTKLLSTKPQ